MIRQIWYDFVTAYKDYSGTGPILVLFVVALMLIAVLNIRNGREEKTLSAIFAGIGTIALAMSKFVLAVFDKKNLKKSYRVITCLFALALCVFAVSMSGRRIFSRIFMQKAENDMHIPQNLVGVMDELLKNVPEGEIAVFPAPELEAYFSAYSSRFSFGYEERYGDVSGFDEITQKAYTELTKAHPDMSAVADAAIEAGSRYVILKTGIWPRVPLSEFGFNLIYENEGFTVYEYLKEVDAP